MLIGDEARQIVGTKTPVAAHDQGYDETQSRRLK
jgi:hypothetical protein